MSGRDVVVDLFANDFLMTRDSCIYSNIDREGSSASWRSSHNNGPEVADINDSIPLGVNGSSSCCGPHEIRTYTERTPQHHQKQPPLRLAVESLEALCERFRSAYEPTDVSEQGLATYSMLRHEIKHPNGKGESERCAITGGRSIPRHFVPQ